MKKYIIVGVFFLLLAFSVVKAGVVVSSTADSGQNLAISTLQKEIKDLNDRQDKIIAAVGLNQLKTSGVSVKTCNSLQGNFQSAQRDMENSATAMVKAKTVQAKKDEQDKYNKSTQIYTSSKAAYDLLCQN